MLYLSRDQNQVALAQRYLQAVQRSPHGYALALHLLQSHENTHRYFGALTLTVVIHSIDSVDESTLHQLIAPLVDLISLICLLPASIDSNMFILKKQLSNLALIFIRFHSSLDRPLFPLLQALGCSPLESQPFEDIISAISLDSLRIILEFYAILIEDVSKHTNLLLLVHSIVKEKVFSEFAVCISFMNFLLQKSSLAPELQLQTSHALSAWMSYIPNIGGEQRYNAEDITPLIDFLFHYLVPECDLDNDAIASTLTNCLVTLTDILEINPTLLPMETKLILYSALFEEGKWGDFFLNSVVVCDKRFELETTVTAFVDIIIALVQLNSIRLSKSILEPTTQNILRKLFVLSSTPGVPCVDEEISERSLIFWEELANVYEDSEDVFEALFESKDDSSFREAFENEKRTIFLEVAKIYWTKIRIHDLATYYSMKADFNSYRSNVADLFLVIYNILKTPFYGTLIDGLETRIAQLISGTCDLADLEASLFLLFKINDDSAYFESQAEVLLPFSQRVFAGGLIEAFASTSEDQKLTTLVTSTFIQFLASNIYFFRLESGSTYLGKVFDYLFPLIVGNTTPISLLASKTATKICEECSGSLLEILPNLEVIVVEMLKNPSLDSLIRLRMFSAYSVIARGIEDYQRHAQVIYGAVSAVKEASEAMIATVVGTLTEEQEDYLLSLLSCIVNFAKGSGLPDETVDNMADEAKAQYVTYWTEDPLHFKDLVLSMIVRFSMEFEPMAQKTLSIEKCVGVFKAGIREQLAGPFTFDKKIIADYVCQVMSRPINPNAVPYIFSLVECLVSANHKQLDPMLVHGIIEGVFVSNLEFLKTDPDMIKSAIDVFSKILDHQPSLVTSYEVFRSSILGFALDGLNSGELFLIKAVLKFWSTLITLKKGTKEDREMVDSMFFNEHLGLTLVSRLLDAFLRAARSSLDNYYSIFRNLIGKYPVASKAWLVESLTTVPSIDHSKISDKDLEMFVSKLLITRGRRTANEVLKNFWLTTNGLADYNSRDF